MTDFATITAKLDCPHEVIGPCLLINADCLKVLPLLDAGSVDAVVTDPPYPGLTGGHDRNCPGGVSVRLTITESVGNEWGVEIDKWMPQCERIVELGMQVFCSYHSVADVRNGTTFKPVSLATWYKRNSTPTGRNLPRYTTEFIWWLSKKPGLKWDAFDTTCFDVPMPQAGCFAVERILNKDGSTAHPTQKPVALMNRLLDFGAESVLDPFMGSGTTGVAAVECGYGFTGIEIDPGYFEISVRRIGKALKQPDMFIEKPKPVKQEALL